MSINLEFVLALSTIVALSISIFLSSQRRPKRYGANFPEQLKEEDGTEPEIYLLDIDAAKRLVRGILRHQKV